MNRVALVTGGSRGIGRGIVLALAKAGFDVAVNFAGNREAAEGTAMDAREGGGAAGYSVRAEVYQADIGKPEDREGLMSWTRETFGRLDLLVNNAGITSIGRADVLEATEGNMDRLFAVNLKGPFFLTQEAANWMLAQRQEDPARRPKIVNISSISAYAVSTNRADYCMAKAALSMMTKVFAVRLADSGITVHEVCPGVIRSDMTAPVEAKYDRLIADGLTPIRRWGEAEDIGRAVVAIADESFPFSTGDAFHIDGGYHLRVL